MLKKLLKVVFVFFALPAIWYFSMRLKWMESLEDLTMQARYKIRGDLSEEQLAEKTGKAPLNLFYVLADNDFVKQAGEIPIPRYFYAKAMYALQKYSEPAVIASDVYLGTREYSTLIDKEKVKSDEELCYKYFSALNHCVLGGWFNCDGNAKQAFLQNEYPLPLIKEGFIQFDRIHTPILPEKKMVGPAIKIGIMNPSISVDSDDRTRWIPLYVRTNKLIFYTLSLEALRQAFYADGTLEIYGDDADEERYQGQHSILILDKSISVQRKIPLEERQLLDINWFSSWETSSDKRVSIMQVLKHCQVLEDAASTAKAKSDALQFFQQFKSSVIFFGESFAKGKMIKTLIDPGWVPSISAHMNAFKTLYWENYIQHLPEWALFLIIFTLNFLIVSIVLYSDVFGKCVKLFIGLIIIYFLLAFYLFGYYAPTLHLALPICAPFCAILTLWTIGSVYQMIIERYKTMRLTRVFSNYLSPELVANMLSKQEDPKLGGVEKNLTAYFSDIQNFSTFSELLDPESLVALMNEYLTTVTNEIIKLGGTLDKYIGDAVVAMFGAPFTVENHPAKACMAACMIQKHQAFLREKWKRDSRAWPKEILGMRTRIGLCSGDAVVGNMGSTSRFNFTMMGDTVNLAARCESGAKSYGVYTLAAEETYKNVVAVTDEFAFRFVDRIIVKGRKHPSGIYELVGLRDDLRQEHFDCLERFEKGIHFYLSREWGQAMSCFRQSAELEPLQPGRDVSISANPSLVFLQRCEYMMDNPPPEDWNGVFVMKTK